jgi:hypothetical protein
MLAETRRAVRASPEPRRTQDELGLRSQKMTEDSQDFVGGR